MKKNIRKVKKFQKSLICLLIILVSVISYTIGRFMSANADELNYEYQSNNIGYDSTGKGLNADNVKDAIDELYEKVGQCPKGYECFTDEEVNNSNNSHSTIISAYKYDEESCIDGEEETCKKTICYLSKNKNSCSSGTIIDYKVNDTETVRFHVLHDNGTTMTLQAQKNTVYNTAWYLGEENSQKMGPQTIMAILKNATSSWTNVNDITLSDRMTEFNDGTSANNSCTETSCSPADENYGYSYSTLIGNESIGSTIKARMITITETAALGCTTSNKSCPIYLYNYLSDSVGYCRVPGKCTNDTNTENSASYNNGYWTLGANLSNTISAWYVSYGGRVNNDPTYTVFDARAVVVVNK